MPIDLSDGKRRLPMISAVEAYFRISRINDNCFELYVFDNLPGEENVTGDTTGILNVPAHDYFLRGRIALKQAELADDEAERNGHYNHAVASFQMSLEAKPGYICAIRFLQYAAERAGLDDFVTEMEAAADINPNMNHDCPFLDPYYQSAAELITIVERGQIHVGEWNALRQKDQAMRAAATFKKLP
ncbi:MAG TPA: hypothetical protein VJA18_02440 [Candidatus Nanoarchaeia archaeon]|nr:hypothetical protein [Candidatus Nanoarchaeia archaeon]